ncbi:hypothetical protein RhoFasGS6_01498 [Rhodococcus fascians]|nr:hypothetical protein [Rhodococcus fascians]
MARIRSLEPGKQRIQPHTTEVDCHFAVVDDSDGARLLHLTTFGSDNRKSAPKSSQSIQLNLEMAKKLIDVINEAFPVTRT